jgi:hypothetical protein
VFDLGRVIERVTQGRHPNPAQIPAMAASVVRAIPRDRWENALLSAVVDRLSGMVDGAVPVPEPTPEPEPEPEREAAPEPVASPVPAPARRPPRRAAGPSRKVAAIREAWRAELLGGVRLGHGMKRLGECTAADLKLAADDHDLLARRYRRLAELLERHGAEHVHELPAAVLDDALGEERAG